MISIDDHSPLDPSSSHHHHDYHQQQQKSNDLKVSDIDLKSTVAHLDDTNNQQPKFSIRDHVFSLRNKDISCNWPFTPTSLQLCLKHGVKNLLPPFQSLDSLRNNSSLTRCSPEDCLTNEEHVSGFDGKPTNNQYKSNKGLVSTNSSGSKRDKESQFHLHRHSGQTRSKLKLPAASQKPDNASVNTTMTSKVCPVCKIFSSSSNTTLNAHIDQCLTGEGTMKWTDSPKVMVKHKAKPRKVRLMLDIYKTASHCTVEELDRRNGTSWATNSTFPAQECQFQEEERKKEEPRLTKVNPVVADNEGDVYIDTNGTKVRVLSVPKTGLSDTYGGRKSLIMSKKKNSLYKKKHNKKYLKLSPNAGKLCLPNPQARTSQGEDVLAENCSKDERSRENMRVVDLEFTRPPWACSKRTPVSKKLNGNDRKVDLKSHQTKDLVVENHNRFSSRRGTKVKSSLSSINQPINRTAEFRKEATHADCDDDIDDSSQSQHSDDDDTKSKGCKFPSLSKNVSFPAVKFCFKRKVSAVEESRVKFADGQSHDSSKEQSRAAEHESTKKKQEARSITSKSTSNKESLEEIQPPNGNELEYVRTEVSSSIPTTSFIDLSTSFDPAFPTHECLELYQDQICSTNRAPNDVDKQENYYQEVDPIPIPGPPGLFLPASLGGDPISEVKIKATSVHTMDQDSMSTSPVSTVSNSRSSCGKNDTYKKPLFDGDTGFTESGQSYKSFKNDKPCCCSRKEVALNYQDLYSLRKQPGESNTSTPSSLHNGSEMFSVRNYPNSSASDSTVSPLKPVLRLMGKNLTVVKTDEDEFRPLQSSQHPQRPVNFSQYQNDFESQHFNVHPPRSQVDFGPIHLGPARSHYVYSGPNSQAINARNVFAASSSTPVKEIIIINDSPEMEDDNTMHTRFLKGNQGQMNPLSSLVFHGGSFQTSLANRDAAGKWNIGSPTTYYPPTYP